MKSSRYIFSFLFLLVMPLKNECVAQVTAKITGINESNAQKRDSLKVKIEKIYTDVAPPKDIADILINISKDIDAKDSNTEFLNKIEKNSKKMEAGTNKIREAVKADPDLKEYFENLVESMNKNWDPTKLLMTLDNLNYSAPIIQDYLKNDLGINLGQKQE